MPLHRHRCRLGCHDARGLFGFFRVGNDGIAIAIVFTPETAWTNASLYAAPHVPQPACAPSASCFPGLHSKKRFYDGSIVLVATAGAVVLATWPSLGSTGSGLIHSGGSEM